MNRWSLRSRLFVLIILPLIAVACLAGAARYVMAEKCRSGFMTIRCLSWR